MHLASVLTGTSWFEIYIYIYMCCVYCERTASDVPTAVLQPSNNNAWWKTTIECNQPIHSRHWHFSCKSISFPFQVFFECCFFSLLLFFFFVLFLFCFYYTSFCCWLFFNLFFFRLLFYCCCFLYDMCKNSLPKQIYTVCICLYRYFRIGFLMKWSSLIT